MYSLCTDQEAHIAHIAHIAHKDKSNTTTMEVHDIFSQAKKGQPRCEQGNARCTSLLMWDYVTKSRRTNSQLSSLVFLRRNWGQNSEER